MTMAPLRDLLLPSATRATQSVRSKKKLLELMAADLGTGLSVDPNVIFDCFLNRERLGTTALGEGVALPHCRVPGLTRGGAALYTLAEPVDFGAADGEDVMLVWALAVPEDAVDDHLDMLALIAEAMSSAGMRERLQNAADDQALWLVATSSIDADRTAPRAANQ